MLFRNAHIYNNIILSYIQTTRKLVDLCIILPELCIYGHSSVCSLISKSDQELKEEDLYDGLWKVKINCSIRSGKCRTFIRKLLENICKKINNYTGCVLVGYSCDDYSGYDDVEFCELHQYLFDQEVK
jgi:hypothetical protein